MLNDTKYMDILKIYLSADVEKSTRVIYSGCLKSVHTKSRNVLNLDAQKLDASLDRLYNKQLYVYVIKGSRLVLTILFSDNWAS